MKRRIIKIDEEKCNGCGACAAACHEGAIEMINGKAKLTRENYCDGLGDCLPECKANAITFEEREAPAYDEAAVLASKRNSPHGGCPGSASRTIARPEADTSLGLSHNGAEVSKGVCPGSASNIAAEVSSQLRQWPCQIKLVPVGAPYFNKAELLIAADCTAYAYAGLHTDFMRGKITLIGCPKLDSVDYSQKLTEIFALNDIAGVTVLRMEVPCCGGLEAAVRSALRNCGKIIPFRVTVISIDGKILNTY